MERLLDVKDLKVYYKSKEKTVKAVDGVSFFINKGETLGLVGESGCGKTTVGKGVLRLIKPTTGDVWMEGKNVASLSSSEMRAIRKDMQIIFQDPFGSLPPRMTVRQILEEPFRIQGYDPSESLSDRTKELMELVALPTEHMERYPHEFSGGQRQRIAIARAIALRPKLIVCDEAVSALDVSVQSQILNLLCDLQVRFGLAYLFIAHSLQVVKYISDRVGVMYLGKIVEISPSEILYKNPLHPYTQALLSAIPVASLENKKNRIILEGDVPSPVNPPDGCRFCTRCSRAMPICSTENPDFIEIENNHFISCHLYSKGGAEEKKGYGVLF